VHDRDPAYVATDHSPWGCGYATDLPECSKIKSVLPTPSTMTKATVRVLLFGRLREEHGWRERLVELPRPATTVAQLQQQLGIHFSGLRWAVNQDFATPDHPLHPGDELAFLPPITGG